MEGGRLTGGRDMTGEGVVTVKNDAKVTYRVGWGNSGALKRD
jgi:hypothetical protein